MSNRAAQAANDPAQSSATPLIELRKIVKRYGAIVALNHVDFHIGHNEVIGLVGDNGAGKSTLIKILSGLVQPEEGTIFHRDQEIKIQSSRDSHGLGIETIYQDIALVEPMNIVRNIFLGREETTSLGFLRMKSMKEKINGCAAADHRHRGDRFSGSDCERAFGRAGPSSGYRSGCLLQEEYSSSG